MFGHIQRLAIVQLLVQRPIYLQVPITPFSKIFQMVGLLIAGHILFNEKLFENVWLAEKRIGRSC